MYEVDREVRRGAPEPAGLLASDVPSRPGADGNAEVLTPLSHRTVEERLGEQLHHEIVTGSLKPGDRLAYRDLARRFGVSVTPVRVALRELSIIGLVELRPHAGARVSALSLDEVEEIYLCRIGIEGWLAQHGALLLNDEGVARMSALLDRLKRSETSDDRRAFLLRSWELRRCCYEAAGKIHLLERASALYDRSTRYQFLSIADDSEIARSRRSMEALYIACQERDGFAARQTVHDALDWTLSCLTKAIVSVGTESSG